jgi:D-alanyl-D-alanine endopeptidase (penicillin-binding protein 7)
MKKLLLAGLLLLTPLTTLALSAKSFIVTDMEGEVIMSSDADEPRPIASITKLVTAARNEGLDPFEYITITKQDMRDGASLRRNTPLKVGKKYTRQQLTELALISSDNVAAVALGRVANEVGEEIDLPEHTTIVEASGLSPENKSTAREIADIARALYNSPTAIVSIQETTEVGKKYSTNPLLNKPGWKFYLSKTGFIRAAGGCLVVITEIGDRLLTIAILGSSDTSQRWRDLVEIRTMLGDDGFYTPTKKPAKKAKPVRKQKRT